MLLIKTFLKEVPGKGIGLFTDEHIEAGQVWWKWDSEMDTIIYRKQFEEIEEIKRLFVKKYGVKSQDGDYWLYTDNAKFCNHADDPNSIGFEEQFGVDTKIKALKQIEKGDELTLDYRKFVFDFPEGILNFDMA